MEYTVEEISPSKRKISVEVPPEEIQAALGASIAQIKKDVQLAGFRKGKVPNSVLEKRFHDEIEKDAREDLINVHLNQILQETGLSPASPLTANGDNKPLIKGEPYSYTVEFEIRPDFELPNYEGLEVEEKQSKSNEDVIDAVVERFCREHGKLVKVSTPGPVKDGQFANVDLETFLDGKPVKEYSRKNMDLEIGSADAIPQIESLIKSIPVGHTGEKDIDFDKDFVAPELAGNTATVRIKVNAIKELKIPEPDSAFAKSVGYQDVQDMREKMGQAYETAMAELNKSEAQQKLLTQLLRQTEYDLPEYMVQMENMLLMHDYLARLERVGKVIDDSNEDLDKLRKQLQSAAEERARQKIFLLAVAKKENLEVSPQEVYQELYKNSHKMGMPFEEYVGKMEQSGMLTQFRDNLLCDKAMDLIYDRSKIIPVEETANETSSDSETKE